MIGMVTMMWKKVTVVAIASTLAVASVAVALFYITNLNDVEREITASTYIDILFAQFGGLIPPNMARQELQVSSNGSILVSWKNREGEVTTSYVQHISRDELEDLARLIIANGFYSLDALYTTPEGVAVMDAGTAEIRVRIDDREKTVVIDPNIDEYLPQNLKKIVSELREMVRSTIEQGTVVTQVGNIYGRVTDQDGNPIAGMRINIVSGTAPFPEISPITNEEGEYEFLGLPPGSFEVAVHDDQGTLIQTQTVTVKAGVTVTADFIVLRLTPSEGEVSRLMWHRTGGLMGLNEELIIELNGSASYSSNLFGDVELVLTEVELNDLLSILEKANFFTLDRSYAAIPGAADYFSYSLTVQTTLDAKTVEWVDGWASERTIPSGLEEVQLYIQTVVERIREDAGVSGDADKRAIKIAQDFIVQAPTYKYDGIRETLNVTDVKVLESFPVQYVITITFDSGHAGYGDRTGQVLAQVITPHTAVVKVVNDNVVSAVLD
ncbi:MAG: carboxypeptidase regulatory-like domain-containing protein, partial [Candidatus Bathyarchaeia archaeon]